MALSPGTSLGPYEISALIGVGGMGEVYRATDMNLRRQVAIKVLPEIVARDPDRLLRFRREAEVLASLNHPNIATIHGLEKSSGVTALVMELVEGPTLADRIASGPIAVDEALLVAGQIADALEAAHERNIVHRDLKPANVKVRADRTVKVLDFGLAKAIEPASAPPQASQSPTITTPATQSGVILGTAAYMSPEQARGHVVSKRSDVWAFGAVLYEMLTGRPAFRRETVTDTLAAIVKEEPDWAALPEDLPARVASVLRGCLQKDEKRRLRDIGDVRLALDGALDLGTVVLMPSSAGTSARRPAALFAGGVLACLALGVAIWAAFARGRDEPPPITRFEVVFRPGQGGGRVAFSPDGRTLVYRALGADGLPRLYRRPMDRFEPTTIDNTEDAIDPFFSPDGGWLGFFVGSTLRKVSTSGGPAQTVAELPAFPRGATWDTESIVVAAGGGGLLRVPLAGGTPTVIAPALDGRVLSDPQLLPGGRALLFTEARFSAGVRGADAPRLQVLDLDTGQQHSLLDGSAGRVVSTGQLVFERNGALWGVRFDPDARAVRGTPVPLVEVDRPGIARFAVAADGSLAYVSDALASVRSLVWVTRGGREEAIAAPPRGYTYPRLSPDGTQVAIDVREETIDIWLWAFAGETLTRLTFDPAQDEYPVWTRDGTQIFFASFRDNAWGVFLQSADGSGMARRVGTGPEEIDPMSISADGQTLVARVAGDLVTLPVRQSAEVIPLLTSQFGEGNAEVSPDGRWIAYQSNETGRDEIFVRPFPAVASGLWQVSNGGGTHPLWGSAGRELFYVSPAGLMSVPTQASSGFAFGNPSLILKDAAHTYWLSAVGRSYDVSPDSLRFLMLKEAAQSPSTIRIVRNWHHDLNRLVPPQ